MADDYKEAISKMFGNLTGEPFAKQKNFDALVAFVEKNFRAINDEFKAQKERIAELEAQVKRLKGFLMTERLTHEEIATYRNRAQYWLSCVECADEYKYVIGEAEQEYSRHVPQLLDAYNAVCREADTCARDRDKAMEQLAEAKRRITTLECEQAALRAWMERRGC